MTTAQAIRPRTVLFMSLYTEIGGGEVGLINIITNLDRSQYQPVLIVNRRGPLTEKLEPYGIVIVVMPFDVVTLKDLIRPKHARANWAASQAIRQYCRNNDFNAIVCSDVLALLLLIPTLLNRPTPVIYNVIFYYETLRIIVFNLLALLFVDRVVTLADAMRVDLEKKTIGLREKISVVYWGIDFTRFRPQDPKESLRSELGLPLDKKVIGFIGRYETWKGHLTFLRAAAKISQQRDDCLFLIVGGAMTEEIIPEVASYRRRVEEAISSSDVRDRCIVWNHRDDIPKVMASLDVFVCPSDKEPYGLVVLEAVASCVPVVASRSVGALEVFNQATGVYVAEPKNPESFAGKIQQALDAKLSPDPNSIRHLTWRSATEKYEEIFQRVAA